jgi:dihydropteroate synthase
VSRDGAPGRARTAAASSTRVRMAGGVLELGSRPWLMGIVNTSPDSFSDGGRHPTLRSQFALARRLLSDGADILDVGGESATTGRAPLDPEREIERVVPLVERIAGELGALVSVDTYKPDVARAAIAAGARIVHDVSGLSDRKLASVCAQSGAALVLMHTRAPPRERLQDPERYDDVTADALAFLRERIDIALAEGMHEEQLIVDPGPDFSKTPAQTIELLLHVERLHELGRPLLMAISRKDFLGALTQRPPRGRLAGSLAALAHGVEKGARIFRVHDVADAADFLAVRAALAGEREPSTNLELPEDLRHERPRGRARQTR